MIRFVGIGSGTGSVSVEMALQCGSGRVYAVDRNPEAVSLTDKNKHIFKCDNIEIIGGNAMDNIEKLPVPDRVFIGGQRWRITTDYQNGI